MYKGKPVKTDLHVHVGVEGVIEDVWLDED